MQYQATAQYVRISPRKARLVADVIRSMSPGNAVMYLKSLPKRGSEIMIKVIESALANAKNKNANMDSLVFKTIEVMEGTAMKRWQPVSKGSAHPYKKRMSHIRIILSDSTVNTTVKSELSTNNTKKIVQKVKKGVSKKE